MVLICCTMDLQLWHVVWMKIKGFLDKARLVAKNWFKTICNDLGPQLDEYRENYTKLVGEVPIVKCVEGNLLELDKYSLTMFQHQPLKVMSHTIWMILEI